MARSYSILWEIAYLEEDKLIFPAPGNMIEIIRRLLEPILRALVAMRSFDCDPQAVFLVGLPADWRLVLLQPLRGQARVNRTPRETRRRADLNLRVMTQPAPQRLLAIIDQATIPFVKHFTDRIAPNFVTENTVGPNHQIFLLCGSLIRG